jgi:succinate dehydrogenase/fumarate reductase flavoprotein subunit
MPLHDENMMTSIPGVYVAGDVSGVEEANTALDEGRLAGVAMAEQLGLIDTSKAAEMKNDLLMRLRSLRMGPFGFKRADAKDRVMEYSRSHKEDLEDIFITGKV